MVVARVTDLLADLSAKWGESQVLEPSLARRQCIRDLDSIRADHTLVRTAELEALVVAAQSLGNSHDWSCDRLPIKDFDCRCHALAITAALAPFERKEGE